MNAIQTSRNNMCASVIAVVDDNEPAWSAFPPFADAVTRLKAVYETVSGCVAMQSTKTKGTTIAKETLRNTNEDQVLHVADTVVLHYKLTNQQQEVYDIFNTKSGLKKLSDIAYVGYATKVVSTAGGITPAILTALGLTPAEFAAAASNLELFVKAIGGPRKVKGQSKLGTANLANAMAQMMSILEDEMDPAARVLQYSKPDFYFEYQSAREIIDPGHRTRELTVNVTEAEGAGLENVEATIQPGAINKITSKNGTFYIQSLDGGIYTVVLSRNGYQPKTIEFAVVKNEATVVNAVLVPNP